MKTLDQKVKTVMGSRIKWTIALAVPCTLIVTGWQLYTFLNSQSSEASQSTLAEPNIQPSIDVVAALGRIEPKDEVITISGSSALQFARVGEILVKEGETVQRGQIIAILDNLNQLKAALLQAKQEVKLAQAQLEQVQAGRATRGEVNAQKARIASLEAQFQGEVATQEAAINRLKAEFQNALTEYSRFEELYSAGAISASEIDSHKLAVATLQEQINEAEADLKQISSTFPKTILEAEAVLAQLEEVRPVDERVAQAELESALASVHRAEADLELAYVRAPVDGQILTIHTFAGESISSEGIVDLAQTQEMYVIAEVYETEISTVSPGQRVTISSSALTRDLQGTVEQIGLRIGKKDVFNSDPTLDIDARVIETKIRLDPEDGLQAAKFINLQVEVAINTSS